VRKARVQRGRHRPIRPCAAATARPRRRLRNRRRPSRATGLPGRAHRHASTGATCSRQTARGHREEN